MTHEQLSQLRTMPRGEVLRKYLPMKTRGEINEKQFTYVLSQAFQNRTDSMDRPQDSETQQTDSTVERSEDRESARQPDDSEDADAAIDLVLRTLEGRETTHVDGSKGVSQKAKLLTFLQDGLWHTTVDIAQNVYGVSHPGICRIAARIHDLKDDGHDIESEKQTGTIWKYRLVP